MNKVIINSNAKVNIGLKVLKEREDGYHDIVTVFQEITCLILFLYQKNQKGATLIPMNLVNER
ncbi:MAG: hypothetical protein Ct9H300mP18_13530 [Candidatus Neomarinimicrobiota bacterium]|nr:MAG: hypothetical protein Ct9H300mP18_13530 [Candidatus Neomarinimicrobiota bacterium]